MGALLRLLVAGRLAARARTQARLIAFRLVAGMGIAFVSATAFGFLLVAAYQALHQRWAPPLPAVILGVALLVLAAIMAGVAHLAARRLACRSIAATPAVDPALAGLSALAGKVPSSMIVAAIAGFVYGLSGRTR
ncbi:MAG: hypothetical protein IT561_16105 [Alphaproteobacteria bacterium]|nr:hypothetical protein [Alphaproteobacteria bacterium]